MPTPEEKLAELRRKGASEDLIQKMLALPDKVATEALSLGLTLKEVEGLEEVSLLTDTGDVATADIIEVDGRTFKAFGGSPPPKKAVAPSTPGSVADLAPPQGGDLEPDPGDPNEPAEIALGEPVEDTGEAFTPDELSAIATAIGPVVAQQVVEAFAPLLDLEKRLVAILDQAKGAVGAASPMSGMMGKEANFLEFVANQPQANQDIVLALGSLATELKGLKDTSARTNEDEEKRTKELNDLRAEVQTYKQQHDDAEQRLRALEGDVPSGVQQMLGMRASSSQTTITNKNADAAGPQNVERPDETPGMPYVSSFIDAIIAGKPLS